MQKEKIRNAKNQKYGYIFILLSAICSGLTGVIAKIIYQFESDPLTVVTLRVSGALILLFLYISIYDSRLFSIRKKDFLFFLLYGFLGVTCSYSFFLYSVKLSTVATAVSLLYTYSIWVNILSAIFLNKRFSSRKILGSLLTSLGVFLIVKPYGSDISISGILFGLGASISYAFYAVFSEKATGRYNPLTLVFYSLGFGTIFLILVRTPQVLLSVTYSISEWFALLSLSFISTLLYSLFYINGIKHIEARQASIVSTFEVIVASLLAYYIFHENIDLAGWLGILMIVASVTWSSMK